MKSMPDGSIRGPLHGHVKVNGAETMGGGSASKAAHDAGEMIMVP
jgi:hypothetical protein